MINNTYLVRIFDCLQFNQFNLLLSFICLLRTLCVGITSLRNFGRCCPITLSQWSSTVSTCQRLLLPTPTLTSRNLKTFQVELKLIHFIHRKWTFFPSIDFALHIQRVSRDPSLFASYFWWKKYYKVEPCNHHIICHKKLFEKVSCKSSKLSQSTCLTF